MSLVTKYVDCIPGLPHRNGDRHAPEIATMALDIVDSLSQLEIPHIPGNPMVNCIVLYLAKLRWI